MNLPDIELTCKLCLDTADSSWLIFFFFSSRWSGPHGPIQACNPWGRHLPLKESPPYRPWDLSMQEIALCFSSPWEEHRAEYCSGLHQADTTSHPNSHLTLTNTWFNISCLPYEITICSYWKLCFGISYEDKAKTEEGVLNVNTLMFLPTYSNKTMKCIFWSNGLQI